jgi:hypothetical protein
MQPTPKLRFVERDSYSHNGEHFATPHKVRILQQLWMPTNEPYQEWLLIKDGKWIDIPMEKENE